MGRDPRGRPPERYAAVIDVNQPAPMNWPSQLNSPVVLGISASRDGPTSLVKQLARRQLSSARRR
ncbi:hypothetical protein PJP10_09170 [Mycobacterium kansasii]